MPPNDSQQSGETLLPPKLEGFIERYGLHTAAEGWIFWGWLSQSWLDDHGQTLTAVFEHGSISGPALIGHYPRRDLRNRGSGVCLFLETTQRHLGKLLRIELEYKKMMGSIALSDALREIPDHVLASHAEGILKLVPQTAQITALREVLGRRPVANGFIDYYGHHPPSAGWMICGWVSENWTSEPRGLDEVALHFESGVVTGPASVAMFEREDLRGKGTGLILHVGAADGEAGPLVSVQLRAGQALADLRPASTMVLIAPGVITDHILPTIMRAKPGPGRDTLRILAERRGFEGNDTIGRFAESFMIDFDAVVICPGDCVMLFGWLLARPGALRALRLRSGRNFSPIDLSGALWIARPDVIGSVGAERGYDNLNCGFILRVPTHFQPLDDLHIEAEAGDGEIGYRKLPPARLTGLPAIKRILGATDHQYADIDARYDRIFGPAVRSLNAGRLAAAAEQVVDTLTMGRPPAAPLVSLVVPLFGRIDFIELQLALFSAHDIGSAVEILYVLDDPPRRRDAQALAASAHARFGIPFRLLILSQNLGFAPANNVGLRAAAGDYVCFMNSDVFPITPDWPALLAARLEQNPDIGVIGPLLLFEDGSIQHRGMFFRKLPMFGNWHFPQHVQKGWRIEEGGLVRPLAITGACMMLRRDLALDVGGMNEAYAIGDFEDSDLCMTLRGRGLSPAVDLDVRMHHLERKSQATSAEPWRVNLTLYNAWTHERRWAKELESLAAVDTQV
jgi:GT2 family glycosyltransferase